MSKKDIWDKMKITSGICKDNWKLFAIIFASLSGNAYQAWWSDSIEEVAKPVVEVVQPKHTVIKEKCKPQVCVCKCEIPLGKHVQKYHE